MSILLYKHCGEITSIDAFISPVDLIKETLLSPVIQRIQLMKLVEIV